MEIKELHHETEKRDIAEYILRLLPDYFGIEESTREYIENAGHNIVFAAYEQDSCIGFISALKHNSATMEIDSMGVLHNYHHQHVGSALMNELLAYAKRQGFSYVSVKTLSYSHPDEGYRKTRCFYYSFGFQPLEENKGLWGMDCPCLLLVKHIQDHDHIINYDPN